MMSHDSRNPDFPPSISVIIVTWNSGIHLPRCLDSLSAQTYKDFEIILIDNGSTDGCIDQAENAHSELIIRIERLSTNKGFAAANNIGARMAHGHWLAMLNADAFPQPDWLEELVHAVETHPEFSFFASRQIQADNPMFLDGAGDEYHVSGLAWRRYYNHLKQEDGTQEEEVFGSCAAAALYKRADFLGAGGFDEDFFSYFEDVDLSFRLRLVGGRCLYVPQAVVCHVGSASTGKLSDFVIYHGHRNLEWTYLKNMPWILFWFYMPLHVLMNIYFLVSFALKGKKDAIFKAKIDAFRNLFSILNKRRVVQKTRIVSILDVYNPMAKGLLSPYFVSRRRNSNGKKIKFVGRNKNVK